MIRTLLLATAGLLCAPSAHADVFHLGSEADAKRVQSDDELGLKSLGNTVEGVLLEEVDGYYKVRTVGGVTYLKKDRVYKIDNDGLTVAKIEEREKEAAKGSVLVNQKRRELLAMERNLRTERRALAAEARAESRSAQAAEASLSLGGLGRQLRYDPVLDVAVPSQVTGLPLNLALELQYDLNPTSQNARLMRLARRYR